MEKNDQEKILYKIQYFSIDSEIVDFFPSFLHGKKLKKLKILASIEKYCIL